MPERKASRPPSTRAAHAWTVAALFYWFLLPVAVHYERRARREAADSNGLYTWPRHLGHRPVLLWFLVFSASMAFFIVMGMLLHFGP